MKATQYWEKHLDNIIEEYNAATDGDVREYLYRTHLDYPLRTMINILSRKLYSPELLSIENLQEELLSFVVLQLHKYNLSKGKSFSYFTVILKHRIFYLREKAYNDKIEYTDIDGWAKVDLIQAENEVNDTVTKQYNTPKYPKQLMYIEKTIWDDVPERQLSDKIKNIQINKIFKNPRQQQIATAILSLLHTKKGLKTFHKKEFYQKIRQKTGHKTVHIKKIVDKLKPLIIL